jgi:hypothetical protein
MPSFYQKSFILFLPKKSFSRFSQELSLTSSQNLDKRETLLRKMKNPSVISAVSNDSR